MLKKCFKKIVLIKSKYKQAYKENDWAKCKTLRDDFFIAIIRAEGTDKRYIFERDQDLKPIDPKWVKNLHAFVAKNGSVGGATGPGTTGPVGGQSPRGIDEQMRTRWLVGGVGGRTQLRVRPRGARARSIAPRGLASLSRTLAARGRSPPRERAELRLDTERRGIPLEAGTRKRVRDRKSRAHTQPRVPGRLVRYGAWHGLAHYLQYLKVLNLPSLPELRDYRTTGRARARCLLVVNVVVYVAEARGVHALAHTHHLPRPQRNRLVGRHD